MEKQNVQEALQTILANDRSLLNNRDALAAKLQELVAPAFLRDLQPLVSALHTVNVGELFLAADNGEAGQREAAKSEALQRMLAANMQERRAHFVVEILAEALGWNNMDAGEKEGYPQANAGQNAGASHGEIAEARASVRWICQSCGYAGNAGNFCVACGQPRQLASGIASPAQPAAAPSPSAPAAPAQTESTTPAVQPMPPALQQQAASGGNNTVLFLSVIILLLLAGGGWYFYHQQEKIKEATASVQAMQENQAAIQQSQAAAQEEHRARQQAVARAYRQEAVNNLERNEKDLASLASAINSGKHPRQDLLRYEADVLAAIKERRSSMARIDKPENSLLVDAAEDLFSIQIMRANCMANGIRGDKDQYRVGGTYYDKFYEKYDAFKAMAL